VVLEQSSGNLLGLPLLVAVVLVAIVVSALAHGSPNPVVLGVCAGAAVLDGLFAAYVLRNLGATLVVTPDEITFRRHGNVAVINRAEASRLRFRTARNGPMGSQYTGYTLKLRDDATGQEVFVGTFGGRRRVQQACEAQGWSFA
jgi:hypothetical protein